MVVDIKHPILGSVPRHNEKLRLGEALSEIGRKYDLSETDLALFEKWRGRRSEEPLELTTADKANSFASTTITKKKHNCK